ncbi:MAG TPA: hypothetical protein VF388_01105 [Lacunisphaera sp.]
MSREHLWSALGRGRLDLEFSGRLLLDPPRALQEAGYDLTPAEIEMLRQALAVPPAPPVGPGSTLPAAEDIEFQRAKMRERINAQVERINDLGRYTVNILKDTLDNARSAYHRISLMNAIMFFTGIALFLCAAAYGAFFKDTHYTLVLAGLGAANFVALFVLGPIERTQTALSNLVQVEIAFMNYFEQITFWENYALAPKGNPPAPDPANIREASEQLQRRSQETIALLQNYVEAPLPGPSNQTKSPSRESA